MPGRLGVRLATVGVLSIVGVIGMAAVSWACHPEITASSDCGGVVHFTTTAWTTSNTAARTNPTIGVSYSIDNGTTFANLPQQAGYHFGADNSYSFSDTFNLEQLNPGAPLPPNVIVKATALGTWGNGDSSHSSRQIGPVTVQPCAAVPGGSISDVDCSAQGSVLVRLSNDGDEPASFTVTGPDGTEQTSVSGHATATRTETPAEDADATYTVSADGMNTVSRTVHGDCVQPAPVASLHHDCDGIHVTLANTAGSQDAVFTVTTSDGTTEQIDVAPGESSDRTYAVAEGATRTVTVTSAGMDAVSDTFTCTCAQTKTEDPPAENPPAADGGQSEEQPPADPGNDPSDPSDPADPPVTTTATAAGTTPPTAVLATSGRRSALRTTPTAVRSTSAARQLPFTGSNTPDLLTVGLLSVVFGAALTSAGRRRGDAG
jgi:hypothetical protein